MGCGLWLRCTLQRRWKTEEEKETSATTAQQETSTEQPGALSLLLFLLILNTKVIKDTDLWVLYLGQWKIMESMCSY